MTQSLNILRIADVPNNPHGGMGKAMYGTGRPLEDQGHEITYWFDDDLSVPGPQKLRRFTVPLALPHLIRKAQTAAGRPFDVVEIHEPLAGPYTFARHRSAGVLPPCVVMSHGLEERRHEAELAYRRRVGQSIGLKRRFSPHTVIQQARYAVRHAERVLCCNTPDRDHLRDQGVPAERLVVKPSGLDPAFLGQTTPPAWDRPAFLFFGSWLSRKGSGELISAGGRLLQNHPHATLTLAGIGGAAADVREAFPPETRSRVQPIASIRGDAALLDLYRRHSVLVLPSFYEGQPLVMLEAAASGLALATTGVCGMLDFVDHGVEGLLVEPGNADELLHALDQLASDAALRQRLGEAGRIRAQRHGWDAVARTVEHAYRSAAKPPPPRRLATSSLAPGATS